jgi:chloramphenicol O-acetyltransferase type A
MKTLLDLSGWNRAEHFRFFKDFSEPYFGLTAPVDCTSLYKLAKATNTSFFLRYLYASCRAANQVENFRYRIEEGNVVVYDKIHASSTIGRPDGTFGFSFIEDYTAWEDFYREAAKEVERVKQTPGLCFNENAKRQDTCHYSAIPWSKFSSLTHARHFDYPDSAPKISFGKVYKEGSKLLMPIAVYVNHALMDAYHVNLYLEALQEGFDNNPTE